VNIITPIKHSSQEKIYSIILYGRARGCFQTLFYQNGSFTIQSIQTQAYLNLYDVNSLYPSVMTSYMPCGQAFLSKGIKKIYDALFQSKQLGFIEAIATAWWSLYANTSCKASNQW
jgi:hypothetical protein